MYVVFFGPWGVVKSFSSMGSALRLFQRSSGLHPLPRLWRSFDSRRLSPHPWGQSGSSKLQAQRCFPKISGREEGRYNVRSDPNVAKWWRRFTERSGHILHESTSSVHPLLANLFLIHVDRTCTSLSAYLRNWSVSRWKWKWPNSRSCPSTQCGSVSSSSILLDTAGTLSTVNMCSLIADVIYFSSANNLPTAFLWSPLR